MLQGFTEINERAFPLRENSNITEPQTSMLQCITVNPDVTLCVRTRWHCGDRSQNNSLMDESGDIGPV